MYPLIWGISQILDKIDPMFRSKLIPLRYCIYRKLQPVVSKYRYLLGYHNEKQT